MTLRHGHELEASSLLGAGGAHDCFSFLSKVRSLNDDWCSSNQARSSITRHVGNVIAIVVRSEWENVLPCAVLTAIEKLELS